jgi:hypothetical protein
MQLSQLNTLAESAAWLSAETNQQWSVSNVIDQLMKLLPESVLVVIPRESNLSEWNSNGILTDTGRDRWVMLLRVGGVSLNLFLSHLLIASSAIPIELSDASSGRRFVTETPIPAEAVRLTIDQAHDIFSAYILSNYDRFVDELNMDTSEILDRLQARYDAAHRSDIEAHPAATTQTEPDTEKSGPEHTDKRHNQEWQNLAEAVDKTTVGAKKSSVAYQVWVDMGKPDTPTADTIERCVKKTW